MVLLAQLFAFGVIDGGYMMLPGIDVSVNKHHPLCDDATFGAAVASVPFEVVQGLCDTIPECTHVSGVNPTGDQYCMRQWANSGTLDSFISTTTCGSSIGKPTVVNGSYANPPQQYLRCASGAGHFEIINTFALPPSVIQQACDNDDRCAGYLVAKNRSKGSTLKYGGSADVDAPGYIKLAVSTK